jgi:hypothetical protein
MDFFLVCYEFIKEDFRKVLESSIIYRKILGGFNTNLTVLIPKDDNMTSFKKFRPISIST